MGSIPGLAAFEDLTKKRIRSRTVCYMAGRRWNCAQSRTLACSREKEKISKCVSKCMIKKCYLCCNAQSPTSERLHSVQMHGQIFCQSQNWNQRGAYLYYEPKSYYRWLFWQSPCVACLSKSFYINFTIIIVTISPSPFTRTRIEIQITLTAGCGSAAAVAARFAVAAAAVLAVLVANNQITAAPIQEHRQRIEVGSREASTTMNETIAAKASVHDATRRLFSYRSRVTSSEIVLLVHAEVGSCMYMQWQVGSSIKTRENEWALMWALI